MENEPMTLTKLIDRAEHLIEIARLGYRVSESELKELKDNILKFEEHLRYVGEQIDA